jgi:hypothetical protein
MAKVLVPDVIDMEQSSTGEYLPAVRRGLLARFRENTHTSRAVARVEDAKTVKLANVRAAYEILEEEAKGAADHILLEYQLAKSVEVSKAKIDVDVEVKKYRAELKAKRDKIIAKIESEAILDMEVEGLIDRLEALGLDPLQEAQHRIKAKKTAEREKARQRVVHL